MRSRFLRTCLLVIASLGVLACDLSTLGLVPAAKPKVIIQSPATGAQFREGDEITVQSTSTDSAGVVRVELAVDGVTVRSDTPPIPQGQASFTLVQKWKATQGTHTLSVRAFNAAGAASDPAFVSVSIAPAVVEQTVVPTLPVILPPIGVTPTLPPSAPTPILPLATPTQRPPTRVPPSPTTISAPPGVYAVSIRLDPAAPKRGQFVAFFVTFLNTTGVAQGYRWRIRIFEPDKRNSFGDTAPVDSSIPPGTSEFASAANWRVTGHGDCMQFFARVFAINPENRQETEFTKPDGSGGPATQFQVCP